MNYEEALKYIHGIVWRGSRLGLERTYELLERLGNPQKQLKFVHVAGTNGKGSTSAMIASVLQNAGCRVGLYTSPYIYCFNERMQVNGERISDDELAELTAWLRPEADAMEDPPTEFELITVLAFEFFRRHHCDIVVLEVGMGGALDSTNVIDTPEAAVITSISLDHTRELGETISAIASTKAGIMKPHGDVVVYGQNAEADTVIAVEAIKKDCHLYLPKYDTLKPLSQDLTGQTFSYGRYPNLRIPLLGTYQLNNAALAITTLELLQKKGWHISEKNIRNGLAETKWPGRFELLVKKPAVLVDGSHNPQGIRATAESLRQYFPQGGIVFLVGVLADKDVNNMVDQILPLAGEIITTEPANPRALPSGELAAIIRRLTTLPVVDGGGIRESCLLAAKLAGPDGVICALGSLYMIKDITKAMKEYFVS